MRWWRRSRRSGEGDPASLRSGTLAVGSEGDATIIDIERGAFEFHDTQGERLAADQRFGCREWWSPENGGTQGVAATSRQGSDGTDRAGVRTPAQSGGERARYEL
jgi:predicted amidohydrolase